MQKPIEIQIQNADPANKSMKDVVEEFTENLKWHLKLTELNGKIKKCQYDSYIAEGFTEHQALFLIK